jgi:U3-containing 90S pre-ribosomal complex subunit
MGGDDLGSDDEFQAFVVQDGSSNNIKDCNVSDDENDSVSNLPPQFENDTVLLQQQKLTKKRKLNNIKVDDIVVSTDEYQQKQQQKSTNTKKIHGPVQLLLQAGRDLECQDAIQQALFLNTALSHYTAKLATTNNEQLIYKLKADNFKVSIKQSLEERIVESISLKKLKKWKEIGSPCIVIVCLSARRAVMILKNLSKLKIRAAKLFPKNGSISEQCEQLLSTSYGLAVGTPHRLLTLCQQQQQQVENKSVQGTDKSTKVTTTTTTTTTTGCLSFHKTKLIVLDSDTSNKQYTVCTLPDTAPHCMELIRDYVIPQIQKRQDMQLAFF